MTAIPAPTGKRRAVLIGCNYPRQPAMIRLAGPTNDVRLLETVLTERLAFAPADIRTLTDGEEARLDSTPTRANVELAIKSLASDLSAGDQAIILLGGQSSSGREASPANDAARSGTFWPTDVVVEMPAAASSGSPPSESVQHRGLGTAAPATAVPAGPHVTNGISGADLAHWLKPLVDKHASVCVICDLCYGGFARQLADSAKDSAPADAGAVVFLYACQPDEETPEMALPSGSASAVRHGLFSYTICEALSRSSGPLTYAELIERVKQNYVSEGRFSPVPWCAGRGTDRPMFGGAGSWDAPFRVKAANGERYTLSAGSLLGLTKGCILRVLASDDPNHPTLGQLRVLDSTDNEAIASPVEFGAEIPVGAWAQLAFIDFGTLRLRVAFSPQMSNGEKIPQAIADKLEILLDREARRHGTAIEVVAPADQPDWILQFPEEKSDSVWLAPAAALQGRGAEQEKFLGPFPISEFADEVAGQMSAIARANNLLALARISTAETERGRSDANVQLEMLKFSDANDKLGTALSSREGPPQLAPGTMVGWRLTNLTDAAADVTLVFIDSEMNATSIFPRTNSQNDNRLPPHGTVLTTKARVTASTSGVEHVVLISTKAGKQLCDFSFLETASLELALSTPRGVENAQYTLNTPLGKLLQNAFYGEGQQRGLSVADINRFPVSSLAWRVKATGEKQETPAPHSK